MKSCQNILFRPDSLSRLLSAAAILLGIILTGCTHNNGDIGVWFGTWTLCGIIVDGREGEDYTGNATWSFQNSVVKIQEEFPHNMFSDHYGTWKQEVEDFTLDFTHTDAETTEPWQTKYSFPKDMYFGMTRGVVLLHIETLTGSRAELTFVNPLGQTVTYRLKKLY